MSAGPGIQPHFFWGWAFAVMVDNAPLKPVLLKKFSLGAGSGREHYSLLSGPLTASQLMPGPTHGYRNHG